MPRFAVYTDADVHGPIVDGLIHRGWGVVRAVDAIPEGSDDIVHFEAIEDLAKRPDAFAYPIEFIKRPPEH